MHREREGALERPQVDCARLRAGKDAPPAFENQLVIARTTGAFFGRKVASAIQR
jgi:hypothetical protein